MCETVCVSLKQDEIMNQQEVSVLLPKLLPVEEIGLQPLVSNPLVSIIVPSYNQGKFIRDTIDSILQQDYRPLEIQIIDGASTDETVEVLKSYGDIPELHWISEPDNGVVHAVNKGFAKVSGSIIAIQSSDDMYLPGAISQIVDKFQGESLAGLVYGNTIKVDVNGNELHKDAIGPYSLENMLLLKTWIPQPSAFFRKELLESCGGWDARIPYCPDTDLWLRMAFRTRVEKLDTYLSQRRMHDEQRNTQAKRIVHDYTQMLAQSVEIMQASKSIQKASLVSYHLIRVRYNPWNSDWYVAWHLMRAGQRDSRVANRQGVFRNVMLPLYRKLSIVKQMCKRCLCRVKGK